MTSLDLLDHPKLMEIQGIPTHRVRLSGAMKKARFRGILWTEGPEVFRELARDHKAIPNTTREVIAEGDYGGVHLDDGYWLVCDVSALGRSR